jgi:putative oxidoreductase
MFKHIKITILDKPMAGLIYAYHHASSSGVLGRATYAALRISTGLLFVLHGAQRLAGLLGVDWAAASVPVLSVFVLAGVLEVTGEFWIALGVMTRPLAFLLAAEIVTAYVIAQLPQEGFPIPKGGAAVLLFGLILAVLAPSGSGAAGPERRIRRGEPDLKTVAR